MGTEDAPPHAKEPRTAPVAEGTGAAGHAVPFPADEAERLADLYAAHLLDSGPEPAFDAIARVAAHIAETPIALITLVDETRQNVKACIGLAAADDDRRDAFCAHAIVQPTQTLLVPDTTLDERFRDNPSVVGEPHLRFYCGAPIRSAAGRALGTLCVIDVVPRTLSAPQLQALEDLALQASTLIQARTRIRELEESDTADEHAHIETLRAVAEATRSAAGLEDLLRRALTAIVDHLELGASGLWWHDGRELAVDPLWIDPSGTMESVWHARRGLAYPTGIIIHTTETATRHGDDVLPTVVAAALHTVGVHASFAVPILVEGTVVGAIELIPGADGEPSPRRLLAATQAASAIGHWLERNRALVGPQGEARDGGDATVDAGRLRRRGRIAARLPGAGARGELAIVYEPIVTVATGATAGVEALCRWRDPELGDVAPSEFIPVAETSDAIREIGAHVRRQALRDLPRLAAAHDPERFTLSLNVSARELDDDYARDLLADLDAARVEPRCLTLEVTERLALTGDSAAAGPLLRLAEQGIGIAIDDFGTGFTSLAQLRTLPLSQLKLDHSYILDLLGDQSDRVRPIVAGIVELGHSLGFTIVAEGVETEGQLEAIRALGVDYAQGHLLSRAAVA